MFISAEENVGKSDFLVDQIALFIFCQITEQIIVGYVYICGNKSLINKF